MGAMLRFKQETGKEINELDPQNFSELCVYFWCCVKSASNRDGIPFDYSLMDFADCIEPDDMQAWSAAVMQQQEGAAEATPGDEKKRR